MAVRFFNYSDVVFTNEVPPLYGHLRFAKYVFKAKASDNPQYFQGAGLYAVLLDDLLIYVGKFRGQKKNWRAGNVISSRWIKHIGTFTMLDKKLSFSKKAYHEILKKINLNINPSLGNQILHNGVLAANPELLTKDMGCTSTVERFLIAQRLWKNPLTETKELERFSFIYCNIEGEFSTKQARNIVSLAEDQVVEELQPIANSIKKRTSDIQHSKTHTAEIMENILFCSCAEKDTHGSGSFISMVKETKSISASDGFYEKLEDAGPVPNKFIEHLVEAVELRNDASVEYVKVNKGQLRIRKHVPNGLGFKNAVTLDWQVNKKRFIMQSLLRKSELKAAGLKIDGKTSYTLSHTSIIDLSTLEANLMSIVHLIEKAIFFRE